MRGGTSLDPLSEPLVEGAERAPSRAAAHAAYRHALGARLWRVGVLLRLLTLANGVALLLSLGYSLWRRLSTVPQASLNTTPGVDGGYPLWSRLNDALPPELSPYLPRNVTLRDALRYATAIGVGVGLIVLEACTAAAEATTRSAIGLAFGASGRFWLFCIAALLCAPMMDLEGSLLDGYVSVGAVAVTLLSGLLQALLLLCFPNYRHFCVAELVKPRFSMDASAFPQVYQRDDGGHLHLGVLLPGFSERDNLSMTVNTSEVELVGEVVKLEAPFGAAVDNSNSIAGPFGPFSRTVKLEHPVDCSSGVESLMKHGIVEFRFQKGFTSDAAVAAGKV